MNRNYQRNRCEASPGTVITGRWHSGRYTVLKKLGAGANGVVYLVRDAFGKAAALKMSEDSASIITEVNVLKSFAKVQGFTLGPSLIDVDDWNSGQLKLHFYVMEYIEGPDLLEFVRLKGDVWAGLMVLQLLEVMEKLHRHDWIFGDLKPENIIISGSPGKLRCIDVGGTTVQGRAVKEFTEFFDRGYWGLGSRKAEPSYDLFSVAMIMINLFYPKRFEKDGSGVKRLLGAIRGNPGLQPFESPLMNALNGRYREAGEMRTDFLQILSAPQKKPEPQLGSTRAQGKKDKGGGAVETAAILAITAILYAMYMYGNLF